MATAFETAADILTGGRAKYRPRGGAAEVYAATDTHVVICGPAGTGKSRACLERLHLLASRHPGMRGLIVRKTKASLKSTALVTWESHVIPDELASGAITYYGGSDREPAQYRYPNRSKIMLGGLENREAWQRVMSSDYDVIFAQECIELTEHDWEALDTRLRNGVTPHQQLIGDTNPGAPTHWLRSRANSGGCRMIASLHEDNPVLYDDTGVLTERGRQYMARLDGLTGVRYERLRRGRWVAAEGAIYGDWDESVHLIDRFDIPDDWPRYWAVDFGFTNPTVIQWWAADEDQRLYLYREIVHTQRLVSDHADQVLGLVTDDNGEWTEPKPVAVVCDHDAEGRAQLRKRLRLPMGKADKRVATGIETMQARLRVAGDGRPRLFVLRDSVVERDPDMVDAKAPIGLAEEIPGYVWSPTADGKPNKEEPLKLNDHSCDAGRYLCAHVDRGRPSLRFL